MYILDVCSLPEPKGDSLSTILGGSTCLMPTRCLSLAGDSPRKSWVLGCTLFNLHQGPLGRHISIWGPIGMNKVPSAFVLTARLSLRHTANVCCLTQQPSDSCTQTCLTPKKVRRILGALKLHHPPFSCGVPTKKEEWESIPRR